MGPLENHEVIINLNILKQFNFYQMFNTKGKTIFNRNVYQLSYAIVTAIVLCLIIYGTLGFFIKLDDHINQIDFFVVLGLTIQNYLILFKIYIFLHNADKIWDILNVTRLNFLTSKQCVNNVKTLYKDKIIYTKISKYCFIITIMLGTQWIIFPVVINKFSIHENTDQRIFNIINLRFPVSLHNYNQYYIVFYIIELVLATFITFNVAIIDFFIISLCCTIISQLDVLTLAFKSIGYNIKPSLTKESKQDFMNNSYKEFKSVLFDQMKLHLKVKLYYTVLWPIFVVYIVCNSAFIIFMTYVLIVICTLPGMFSIIDFVKISSTCVYSVINLFMYCYLLDKIMEKKESVNFGIYSCDWTEMDLKFKKLLLLAMRINDVNPLVIKVSPKQIINLQLFSNVMAVTFKVIPVLLKTLNEKK